MIGWERATSERPMVRFHTSVATVQDTTVLDCHQRCEQIASSTLTAACCICCLAHALLLWLHLMGWEEVSLPWLGTNLTQKLANLPSQAERESQVMPPCSENWSWVRGACGIAAVQRRLWARKA